MTATLGTTRDEQIIDALQGEYRDRFMMHYNMPPYATGETGRVGSPKRREIGHGRLAKRALMAMLPGPEEFAYSLRVVSEITESNGSSSMASVCGGCLALMDAGVPLKAHVAGIAMGLIKEGNRFAVLSDILGDEDHLGDMDFKVAGTEKGVTALQMDIKIDGITKEIMHAALLQAREGRLHILEKMKQALEAPRAELSAWAPRMITMKIKPEKIRDVIGKGGAVIRALTEETGTTIDIQDDGTVTIACVSPEAGEPAQQAHRGHHRRRRGRPHLRRHRAEAARFRGDRERAAGQGRTAAHLADRQRARQRRRRPPQGRPGGAREGAGSRRQGPAAPVDEGGGAAEKAAATAAPARRLRHEAVSGQPSGGQQTKKGRLCRPFSYFRSLVTGHRSLLLGDLPLAQLVQRLAVDAQRGGGPRFQALQADLHPAADRSSRIPRHRCGRWSRRSS